MARLVGSVTEPSTEGSFAERKSRLREAVADAGEDTLMIYAADKVAKTRELRMTSLAPLTGVPTPRSSTTTGPASPCSSAAFPRTRS